MRNQYDLLRRKITGATEVKAKTGIAEHFNLGTFGAGVVLTAGLLAGQAVPAFGAENSPEPEPTTIEVPAENVIDLTNQATPAVEVAPEVVTPTEVVQEAPIESAAAPVVDAVQEVVTPVQEVEVAEVTDPVQETEDVIEVSTPVQEVGVAEVTDPVQETEDVIEVGTPVQETEDVIEVGTPVQETDGIDVITPDQKTDLENKDLQTDEVQDIDGVEISSDTKAEEVELTPEELSKLEAEKQALEEKQNANNQEKEDENKQPDKIVASGEEQEVIFTETEENEKTVPIILQDESGEYYAVMMPWDHKNASDFWAELAKIASEQGLKVVPTADNTYVFEGATKDGKTYTAEQFGSLTFYMNEDGSVTMVSDGSKNINIIDSTMDNKKLDPDTTDPWKIPTENPTPDPDPEPTPDPTPDPEPTPDEPTPEEPEYVQEKVDMPAPTPAPSGHLPQTGDKTLEAAVATATIAALAAGTLVISGAGMRMGSKEAVGYSLNRGVMPHIEDEAGREVSLTGGVTEHGRAYTQTR